MHGWCIFTPFFSTEAAAAGCFITQHLLFVLLTRDNLGALVLDMLFHWARGQRNAGPGSVSRLVAAMTESGRRDLAEEIEDIVSLGRRKYTESLKRVGLEAESSSVGEAQQ